MLDKSELTDGDYINVLGHTFLWERQTHPDELEEDLEASYQLGKCGVHCLKRPLEILTVAIILFSHRQTRPGKKLGASHCGEFIGQTSFP